ncbi:MAG: flavodoxin family protein [Lachnospiraceae bacterium]|nr:flavodoxin family protein [Lachnospiraceae bacterium]
MCAKKKVLALQGSFRENGLTSTMLKYAVREAEAAGHDVEYINLHKCKINYCKGCRKCFETAKCIFTDDDLVQIAESIKQADVILLAAPVYWANVPAVVKNLFDRMSGTSMEETNTFPKPRLSGKRYMLFTACNTPMPFAKWFGQTTGLKKAVKEYFKTSGVKHMGTVVCANTSKRKEVSTKAYGKIRKLVSRI